MGFWQLMIKKDDVILGITNIIFRLRSYLFIKEQRLLRKTRTHKNIGSGRDVYVILNGPSLKSQDLTLLSGRSLMFVNRGFAHPLYKSLKPEFHVFVDPKMLSGEWPVTWLDDIIEMVPDITFVMPVSWAFMSIFQPYILRGISFYWMERPLPCRCLGVAGFCFDFAIKQKFSKIYFTGFDANGLAHEMVNSSSHFYGVNAENLTKTTKDYVTDLFMFSRHLRDFNRFAESCKKENIEIVNLTEAGLLDMFPRQELTNIIKP